MSGGERMKMSRRKGRIERDGEGITANKRRRKRSNRKGEGQRRSDKEGGELWKKWKAILDEDKKWGEETADKEKQSRECQVGIWLRLWKIWERSLQKRFVELWGDITINHYYYMKKYLKSVLT